MGDQLTLTTHQISRLLTQGMITHIMTPPGEGVVWSIDPEMIRDLDALKLLVILDDGTVAISCPDGLPDFLRGAASAIDGLPGKTGPAPVDPVVDELPGDQPPPDQPDASAPLSDSIAPSGDDVEEAAPPAEGTFADIADTSLSATDAGGAVTADDPAILSRLEELSAQIGTLSAAVASAAEKADLAPPPEETRTAIGAIGVQMDKLMAAIAALRHSATAAADQTPITDALIALGDRIIASRPAPAEAAPPADPVDPAILARLEEKIDALAARAMPRPDLSAVHQAIARQTTAIATAVRRIEDGAAPAAPPAFPVDDIMARFDGIDGRLSETLQPTDIQRPPSAAEVAEQVARSILPDRAALDAQMLASLRQQMSRHAVAQATALGRLDAATDRLLSLAAPATGVSQDGITALRNSPDALRDALAAPLAATQVNATDMPAWSRHIARLDTAKRTALAERIAAGLMFMAEPSGAHGDAIPER